LTGDVTRISKSRRRSAKYSVPGIYGELLWRWMLIDNHYLVGAVWENMQTHILDMMGAVKCPPRYSRLYRIHHEATHGLMAAVVRD
jgi:hypothetical protein